MDLISSLTQALDLNPKQAQAVAGTALGAVQGQVGDKFGADTAQQLGSQIPELDTWKGQAKAEAPEESGGGLLGAATGALGGGGLGGLLGAAAGAGAMGKQAKDLAAVATVLGRFGVDPGKAGLVAPIVLQFLKKKLDPGLLNKALAAAPMLAALKGGGAPAPAAGAPAAGGLGDAAGGMMGKLGGLLG